MGKLYLFNVFTFYKSLSVINVGSPYGLYGVQYIFYIYMIKCGGLGAYQSPIMDYKISMLVSNLGLQNILSVSNHGLQNIYTSLQSWITKHPTSLQSWIAKYLYQSPIMDYKISILVSNPGLHSNEVVPFFSSTGPRIELPFMFCAPSRNVLKLILTYFLQKYTANGEKIYANTRQKPEL